MSGLGLAVNVAFGLLQMIRKQQGQLPVRRPKYPVVTKAILKTPVPINRKLFHRIDRIAKDITEGNRPYEHMVAITFPDRRVQGFYKISDKAKITPIEGVVMAKLDYV